MDPRMREDDGFSASKYGDNMPYQAPLKDMPVSYTHLTLPTIYSV